MLKRTLKATIVGIHENASQPLGAAFLKAVNASGKFGEANLMMTSEEEVVAFVGLGPQGSDPKSIERIRQAVHITILTVYSSNYF